MGSHLIDSFSRKGPPEPIPSFLMHTPNHSYHHPLEPHPLILLSASPNPTNSLPSSSETHSLPAPKCLRSHTLLFHTLSLS